MSHTPFPFLHKRSTDAGGTPAGAARPVAPGWRRVAQDFARTKRSAVATELAFVALPFFLLFLGTMEVAYDLYVQAAMNYAVDEVASDIFKGQAQASPLSGASTFVSSEVCPYVSGLLDCSLIQANVTHIPAGKDFWTALSGTSLGEFATGSGSSGSLNTAAWSVCTGGPGATVLLQLLYAGPTFVGGFIPAFTVSNGSGSLIHPTYATAGFINENGWTATVSC